MMEEETSTQTQVPLVTKLKRGRKSKKELELLNASASALALEPAETFINEEPKVFKKRGRKPKGGKIIQQSAETAPAFEEKQNVILHLKCSMDDLTDVNYESNSLDAYNTHICNETMYTYNTSSVEAEEHKNETYDSDYEDEADDELTDRPNNRVPMKDIWKKVKQLEHNLHINNISKKSDCFWDTCSFDNPPIYIPKNYINGVYHVYGCFCSPECAVAYLMKEDIDRSAKFERYQLLNDVYSKIYEYKKGIPEASEPRYLLDKYLGNLSIKEYRTLLRSGKMFLVIDKPLTRIFSFKQQNYSFWKLPN